jgi:hypothetical protein
VKTNSDCTLYNKSVINGVEAWTRTQIRDVFWEDRKAVTVQRSGLLEADSVAIYIPFTCGVFSFKPGDILVRGLVTDEISAAFTITALKKKYPDIVSIRSVDRMDYGGRHLQHWQIGCA